MKKILVLTTMVLLAMSSVSFAASTRWNALGGEHRFIIDTSNYTAYPGRMLQFADALWIIPLGTDNNDVSSGLLVKKGDMAWAIHYGLPALGVSALKAGLNSAGGNLSALSGKVRAHPDLFFAKKTGDMTLGARVALGLASSEPVAEKTAGAMSIDVALGVTQAMGIGDVDLGVQIASTSFSDESAATTIESTGGLSVKVEGRAMMPKGDGKTLVPLFSAGFGSDPTVDGATEVSRLGGDVGIGVTQKGQSLLIYGALVGFNSEKRTPPAGDEVSTTTLTVTYLGGYEKPLTSWLTARGGARATLSVVSGDTPSKNGTMTDYYYNFGVRTAYKKAILDLLLNRRLFHRGPYILSGSGDDLATHVCLTYMFD